MKNVLEKNPPYTVKKCKDIYFEYLRCKMNSNTPEESFICDKYRLEEIVDNCSNPSFLVDIFHFKFF